MSVIIPENPAVPLCNRIILINTQKQTGTYLENNLCAHVCAFQTWAKSGSVVAVQLGNDIQIWKREIFSRSLLQTCMTLQTINF